MAYIAIDPTDIRPSQPEPVKAPRRRKTLLVAGGVTLGIVAVGGAGATFCPI
jgi:hypothetical protein